MLKPKVARKINKKSASDNEVLQKLMTIGFSC